MVRASIAVDAEIAESLSKLAQAKHMTLYSLTNQILKTAVDLMRENIEPQDLKDLFTAFTLLKDIDAVVLPSDFMDSLIAELYAVDREKTLKLFRQLGRDVGKYLKVQAGGVEELISLVKTIGRFFPLKKLEARTGPAGKLEVTVLGVGKRQESTLCVLEAIKGILEEYDYTTENETTGKGLLRFSVTRK